VGSAMVSVGGRYFPVALTPETSLRASNRPHGAFAAEADHAASDQNIGTGFFKQAPRFLLGFFGLCLFCARAWPFHHTLDSQRLHPLEIREPVEQQFLLLLVLIVAKMWDRYREAPGPGVGDCSAVEEFEDPPGFFAMSSKFHQIKPPAAEIAAALSR